MSGKRKPVVECKDSNSSSSSGGEEESRVPVPDPKADGSSANRSKGLGTSVGSGSISKGKKKKALINTTNDSSDPLSSTSEPPKESKHNPGKSRTKKEPLPMKLRALPRSFWQQPNATIDISPGQMYAKLPPLLHKDVGADDTARNGPSSETKSDGKARTQVLRVNDTDWIFQLFHVLDQKDNLGKRGRPKKVLPVQSSLSSKTEDPVLGTTLIPSQPNATTTLTMISLKDKDKSVSLPALNVEKNYSQILSEVVVKL